MIRIAILVSGRHGRGSNMEAIARACRDGRVAGEVRAVIGNFADSPALDRARDLGLATVTVAAPRKASPGPEADAAYGGALRAALDAAGADLVCLAGYVRRLPAAVVSAYAGRIMNIHNALLPSFGGQGMYGRHVHEAVLAYGCKVSGCTVHFVDEGYDTGPIIAQAPVPVAEDDTPETLAARVLAAEHETYPRAVALFAAGRLALDGRRVRVT